jgi:lipoprotein NlpI
MRILPVLIVALAVTSAQAEGDTKALLADADRLFKARKYDEALARLDEAIKQDAKLAPAYDLRGSVKYMMGDFKGACADFDQHLKLRPGDFNGHWRRGIALYYVGRYEEGRKQFEGYEKVDTSDVENTFWHWMCVYKKDGEKAAQAALLKTGKDKRTPMNEVLLLIQGKATPEAVLKAANAGELTEAQRKPQLFYGNLYLGLYHDVKGDRKQAIAHLEKAAKDYHNGSYMGEVARVHLEWLKKMK